MLQIQFSSGRSVTKMRVRASGHVQGMPESGAVTHPFFMRPKFGFRAMHCDEPLGPRPGFVVSTAKQN